MTWRKKVLLANLAAANKAKTKKRHNVELTVVSPSRPKKRIKIEPKIGQTIDIVTEPRPTKEFRIKAKKKVGRKKKKLRSEWAVQNLAEHKRKQQAVRDAKKREEKRKKN